MNSGPIIHNLNVILLALTLVNIPATYGESQTLVLSIFADNLGVASPSETWGRTGRFLILLPLAGRR
jgi:hypothetical protein